MHDVLNVFQVTGLTAEGRYFVKPSPAQDGDFIEFFAEIDVLCALVACPHGDLSMPVWGADAGDPLDDLPPARRRDLAAGAGAARGLEPPARATTAAATGCARPSRFRGSADARAESDRGGDASMTAETVTIPARRGKAARVSKGQRITVINTHGAQVVDTWAFSAGIPPSGCPWRPAARGSEAAGRRGDRSDEPAPPILTLVEDTSGGAHDMLMAACDARATACSGVEGHHDNCRDNLHAGLRRWASRSRPRRRR